MTRLYIKPIGATSYKETAFGIISRSQLIKYESIGIKKGIKFLQDLIPNQQNLKISSKIILDLHNISFGEIFPDWAGRFRTIQVEFSGKEAPKYYQVPELITHLCDDLNERMKLLPKVDNDMYVGRVLDVLAWFQHRFVWIHPFNDYNGRTARMLTIFLCLLLGLPPIEIGVKRMRYINAMRLGDNGDLSELKLILFESLEETLIKIKKK